MRHFFLTMGMVLFIFPHAVSAKPAKTSAKGDLNREALLIELTGKDDNTMSDVELYSEIVAAYQARDKAGMKSRVQKFMSRHAKSPFADNALYLAGRMALDQKSYGEALKYFNRVATEYPRSNRVVSAQFAKAIAYKKMNLDGEARRAFREVIQKYPGSPESFRADGEMRMLN